MPYWLPKDIDTPENNAKMERCVTELIKDGNDEEKSIRICKASIMWTTERMSDEEIEFAKKCKKKYYEVQEWEEYFSIKDVELFELRDNAKGLKLDREFVENAIQTHLQERENSGYLPTVFIGHNDGRSEKEVVGFFDNLRLVGNKVYVDFIKLFKEKYEEIKKYPYRSMEVLWGRIAWIALLWSNPPYFKNAPIIYTEWELIPCLQEEAPPENEDTLYSNSFTMELTQFEEEKVALLKQFEEEKATLSKQFEEEKAKYSAKLAEFQAEKLYSSIYSEVSKFELSEDKKVGFTSKDQIEKCAKFACTLSEEGRAMFYEILDSMKSVDLTVYTQSEQEPVDAAKVASKQWFMETLHFSEEEAEKAIANL